MRIAFLVAAAVLWMCGGGVAPHPYLFTSSIAAVFLLSDLLERNGRAAGQGIALAGTTVLLSLAVSDAALRVLWRGRGTTRAMDGLFEYHPGYYGRFRYEPNARIEKRSIGDLAARAYPELGVLRDEVFVTDALGLRNDPAAVGRSADVLLLGDSIGAGISTTQSETISAQLERILGRQVYNLSVPGSPADELYVLKTELPHLKPVEGGWLVWLLFGANDVDDSYDVLPLVDEARPRNAFDRFLVRLGTYQARSPLTRLLAVHGNADSGVVIANIAGAPPILFLDAYLRNARRPEAEFSEHPNMKKLVEALRRGSDLARSAGLHTAVFMVPSKEEIYDEEANRSESSPFAAAVQKHCVTLDLPCIDLKPAMLAASRQALAEGRLLYWPDDTHWNPEGQRVGAELIANELGRLTASTKDVQPRASAR